MTKRKNKEDWIDLSYKIAKIVDRKTGRMYNEYQFALKMYKGGAILYADLEGISLCTNGEYYLIDKCGNSVYIDRAKYKLWINYGECAEMSRDDLAFRCRCLSVNVGALGSINFDLKSQIRLLQRKVTKLEARNNYLVQQSGHKEKQGYEKMKIPGRFSASKSRRDYGVRKYNEREKERKVKEMVE
jgi:hypothetical protein